MQHAMPHFDALDPHLGQHVIWDTLETLAPPGEDSPEQQDSRNLGAAAAMESFRPGTLFEAMVTAHLLALHHGALGCYRWSMQADPASPNASRLRRDGMAMTRTMLAAFRALRSTQVERRADQQHPPQAAPGVQRAQPVADPPAADGTPPAPRELGRRERGSAGPAVSAAAIRTLALRDPDKLTDSELDTLGRATATPEKPHDPAWRLAKPPPAAPYWEDLAPEQRLGRYGYRTEAQIAVARAAGAADSRKPPDDSA